MAVVVTASTSVVLVNSSNTPIPTIYFPQISTLGRLVTVRDSDGFVSTGNYIYLQGCNGVTFGSGLSTLSITQPYGFLTLSATAQNNYSILNTFAFPEGSTAAYASNVTASTLYVTNAIYSRDLVTLSTNTLASSNGQLIFNNTPTGTVTAEQLQSTATAVEEYASNLLFINLRRVVAVGNTSNTISNIANPIGTIIYSDNDTPWDLSDGGTAGFSNGGNDIYYGGGLWIAAGNNSGGTNSCNTGYIQWSLDGKYWVNSVSPNLNTSRIRNRVYWANNLYHAVGCNVGGATSGGAFTILYSQDGKNWSASAGSPFFGASASFNYATSIAFGYGLWVASGVVENTTGNSLLYSPDGSNWTASVTNWTSVLPAAAYDVAFNGIRFVSLIKNTAAVNVATSATGSNWTTTGITNGNFNNEEGYIYGTRDMWMILTPSYRRFSVDGGFTWLDIQGFPSGYPFRPYNDGELWWASVSTNTTAQSIYYSVNGSNGWSNFLTGGGFENGGYAKSFFSFYSQSNLNLQLLSSMQGISINFQTSNLSACNIVTNYISANSITLGKDAQVDTTAFYVAGVRSSNAPQTLFWSDDGSTYNTATSGGFNNGAFQTAYNGTNLWVAVGSSCNTGPVSSILYSSDGKSWRAAATGGFANGSLYEGYDVAFANNTWFAVGNSGSGTSTIQRSFNGSNWQSPDTTVKFGGGLGYGIASGTNSSGQQVWVAVGTGTSQYSTIMYSIDNGSTWAYSANGFVSGIGRAVAYAPPSAFSPGGRWVAVGQPSALPGCNGILYSGDGINWSSNNASRSYVDLFNVAYSSNEGTFVAVGQFASGPGSATSTIVYSTDGITWNSARSGGFGTTVGGPGGQGLTYSLDRWYASGVSTTGVGVIYSSTDNSNWTLISSPPNVGQSTITSVTAGLTTTTTQVGKVFISAGIITANTINMNNGILSNVCSLQFTKVNIGGTTTGAIAIGQQAGVINQGENGIALGGGAANNNQGVYGIAVGALAGYYSQGTRATAVGLQSGQITQAADATAVGNLAGFDRQGSKATAIGYNAANSAQQTSAVAIGDSAGFGSQQAYAVAIGSGAGYAAQSNYSVAIGYNAGYNYQADYSVAIGREAGFQTQSNFAVAMGFAAGYSGQNQHAIAIGRQAGRANQGCNAIAIGCNAGATDQGRYSIAIGSMAGSNYQPANSIILNASGTALNPTTASAFYVTPVRSNAAPTNILYYDTTSGEISYGSNSGGGGGGSVTDRFSTLFTSSFVASTITMSGALSLNSGQINLQTGVSPIVIGNGADQIIPGSYAVNIGNFAGYTGQQNVAIAIGYQAGSNGQQGFSVALGAAAGYSNQGTYSVAVGPQAGFSSQGSSAVAIGSSSGRYSQSNSAVAIGVLAGYSNQASNSVAVGVNAGYTNQQTGTVAIGNSAGSNAQGAASIAIGTQAGFTNQSTNSVAIGNLAGYSNQNIDAVAIGGSAGVDRQQAQAISIGRDAGNTLQSSFSIAIGYQAAYQNQRIEAIAIGRQAGYNLQGSNAIAIGCNAGQHQQGNFSIAIGAGAGSNALPANTIVLNASGSVLNPTQTSAFYVNQVRNQNSFGTQVNYDNTTKELTYGTPASDSNVKENIYTLSSTLDAILSLRPVVFNYKEQPSTLRHYGFIAQEVQPHFPHLVNCDTQGTLGIHYEMFPPLLVSAVHSLQSTNQGLQAHISTQQSLLDRLFTTLNMSP